MMTILQMMNTRQMVRHIPTFFIYLNANLNYL
jgi:hypothetical protein